MKVRIFVVLCLSFFILADCAVLQKKNRTITNYLDEKVDPKSAPAQIALAPLFIPVGLVSLVLDAFVVHPISVIPDAVEDTYKVIWKDPSGGVVFQTVVFFPKLAITPIFFLVDFLGRSGIDF
ncbi:hypothetical protein EHQ27_18810 [Leptospira wolffii]|uniref:Uncharacterized protein n=1 Tax=Leptospira wolffii TaxID=409998 RepID=A0A2M9ZHP4_9LEPT|nr:hypothetical protein [Leptospira wolffii]PJZ67958.1 hypothetical protein CH371_06170 [Leptospira wolffii]TGK62604.1 hypothetical protein EHQ32_07250 [Leptospira wolffii]TGK65579.1 hypothetical protein EHQ27_18810 [Leptospira wolffii]TGK74010.1 hypothetical protein EHQ35_06515 [Leptospira wolffii]TGL28870.1 hypothetical protein EHQ57_13040 [Leptospira wolffii]